MGLDILNSYLLWPFLTRNENENESSDILVIFEIHLSELTNNEDENVICSFLRLVRFIRPDETKMRLHM